MDNIIIRNEVEADNKTVEEIIRSSFWNLYSPGCDEHYLAHTMRSHKDFLPELDLVIELNHQVIGNIMYTKNKLVDEQGNEKDILTFGPVCIRSEHRGKGYLKKLIAESVLRAETLGYDLIIIFGYPYIYVSSGFKCAKRYNVCYENGTYPSAMMVKELKPGALDGRKWTYYQSSVYEVDQQEALQYDSRFKEMERNYQPSQEEFYIFSNSIMQ